MEIGDLSPRFSKAVRAVSFEAIRTAVLPSNIYLETLMICFIFKLSPRQRNNKTGKKIKVNKYAKSIRMK